MRCVVYRQNHAGNVGESRGRETGGNAMRWCVYDVERASDERKRNEGVEIQLKQRPKKIK